MFLISEQNSYFITVWSNTKKLTLTHERKSWRFSYFYVLQDHPSHFSLIESWANNQPWNVHRHLFSVRNSEKLFEKICVEKLSTSPSLLSMEIEKKMHPMCGIFSWTCLYISCPFQLTYCNEPFNSTTHKSEK